MPRIDSVKLRQGTAAEWAAAETGGPQLAAGESALVDGVLVTGDGTTKVASLPRSGSGIYARLGSIYSSWNDVPAGWVAPHRGAGALIAPENTDLAFRIGKDYGTKTSGIIDGGDHRLNGSGTLVLMHDRDLPRTTLAVANTGVTTNLDDLDDAAVAALRYDCIRWFETGRTISGGYGNDVPVMTSEEFFQKYAAHALTTPESKTGGPAGTDTALIALIKQHGVEDMTLFNSYSVGHVTAARAAGLPHVCLLIAGTATPTATHIASLAGLGVKYVGLDHSQVTDGTIAEFVAAGYQVILWTITRQYEWDRRKVLPGVIGCWADDPVYVSGVVADYRKTSSPWTKSGTYPVGYIPWTNVPDANRGSIVGHPGNYRIRQTGPGVGDYLNLLGTFCPLANADGTYSITLDYVIEAIPSDVTRNINTAYGFLDDRKWISIGESYANGNTCIIRANGQIQMYKVTAGVAAQIGSNISSSAWVLPVLSSGLTAGVAVTSLPVNALPSAVQAGHKFMIPGTSQVATASGAAAAGATAIPVNSITPSAAVASGTALWQVITMRIDVTPTTITANRLDGTAASGSATDSTFRGGYIHHGRAGHATGLIHHLGAVTVS